jgi:hypothetical protein
VPWAADSAQVASAVFTAGAAYAAWAAVKQTREAAREANEPDLTMQVLVNADTGMVEVLVINAGGGLAKGCLMVMTTPSHKLNTYLDNGLLRPDEQFHIYTTIPDPGQRETKVAIMAHSPRDNGWAWNHLGARRAIKFPKADDPEQLTGRDGYNLFWPGEDRTHLTNSKYRFARHRF